MLVFFTWAWTQPFTGWGAAPCRQSPLPLNLLPEFHPRLSSYFVLLSVSIIFCCWLAVWWFRGGDVYFHAHLARLGPCCCLPLCLWVRGWRGGGRRRSASLRSQGSGSSEIILGVLCSTFGSSLSFFLFLELLLLQAALLLTKLGPTVLEPNLADRK